MNAPLTTAIASSPTTALASAPLGIAHALGIGGGGGTRKGGWDHSVDSEFINGIKQLQDFSSQFSSGKMTSADYLSKAQPVTDRIDQIRNYYNSYSGDAFNFSKANGLDNYLNNLKPELNILTQGKNFLGRDVTPQEVAQLLPTFQGANGTVTGNAALANLAQQYKANPSLDPGSAQNTQKVPDIQNGVQQQFQSILGRAATTDELSHFTDAIKSGQTDLYGLSGFLKQQPEYTNAQDTQFRSGLNSELQNYDVNEFNREKGGIASDYAARGLSVSPSLDYAMTDLMGKIASNRSAYLANLSSSQYGGNKDLAIGNYQNTLNQLNDTNQTNRASTANMSNYLTQRGYGQMDYQQQMNDYLGYLNSQPKNRGANPLYGLAGGAIGAGIGGFAGGPGGAMAGYNIGSGAGNAYGYLNNRY